MFCDELIFRWYVLESEKGGSFLGRIHLRLCFDGGYHVMDESPNYISDTRPTARQLWRPSLGILEVGIHGANNLLPMKTTKDNRGSTDAYCIGKFGPKWVRTRTIFESFNPRWNEQYTWEVYDPCTVLTVGVFDNRYENSLKNSHLKSLVPCPPSPSSHSKRETFRTPTSGFFCVLC